LTPPIASLPVWAAAFVGRSLSIRTCRGSSGSIDGEEDRMPILVGGIVWIILVVVLILLLLGFFGRGRF